jgi:uncharacterized membrane protein YdjX (TVP38/TMEM64 family)
MLPRVLAISFLVLLGAGIVASYETEGLVFQFLRADQTLEQKVDSLRSTFDSWGFWAPAVYVAIVVVEVLVAPIPGTMLYLPGGVIFGGFRGGFLTLLGNVLGAGLACSLMRTIAGKRWADSFARSRALERFQDLIQRRGVLVVALLRANPLTSSDLVSYAAGLTTLPAWQVMLGTLIGMPPICFVQSYLAQEIFAVAPWLLWPMLVLGIVYVLIVVRVLMGLGKRDREESQTS